MACLYYQCLLLKVYEHLTSHSPAICHVTGKELHVCGCPITDFCNWISTHIGCTCLMASFPMFLTFLKLMESTQKKISKDFFFNFKIYYRFVIQFKEYMYRTWAHNFKSACLSDFEITCTVTFSIVLHSAQLQCTIKFIVELLTVGLTVTINSPQCYLWQICNLSVFAIHCCGFPATQ